MLPDVTLSPIGVIRTPFPDRVSAPRQPCASGGARGTIELFRDRGLEHALDDLEGWDHLWVIFLFHLNTGWRPKVLPPRSAKRRGVLATRSPHRPNPIGLSVVQLERIEGLTLHVRDVDMIDGSPILDIKPYVPAADAIPGARTGWLEPLAEPRDPEPGFEVAWTELARAQAAWLRDDHGVEIAARVEGVLGLGPQPHPYRRIKPRVDGGLELAVKSWRARFHVDGRRVTVDAIASGYRDRDLATRTEPELEVHRAFVARFGRL